MKPRLYVGGTFDLLHPGHLLLLKLAASIGDVVVSLNRDEFTKRYKGRFPAQNLEEREIVIRAVKYVKEVVVNIGDEDSKPAILNVMPDFIVHGADWTGLSLYQQMGLTREWLDEYGFEFLYFDRLDEQSTTELKSRILKGNKDAPYHDDYQTGLAPRIVPLKPRPGDGATTA